MSRWRKRRSSCCGTSQPTRHVSRRRLLLQWIHTTYIGINGGTSSNCNRSNRNRHKQQRRKYILNLNAATTSVLSTTDYTNSNGRTGTATTTTSRNQDSSTIYQKQKFKQRHLLEKKKWQHWEEEEEKIGWKIFVNRKTDIFLPGNVMGAVSLIFEKVWGRTGGIVPAGAHFRFP